MKITLMLFVDDDPVNTVINLSLLKSLEIVKEINTCIDTNEAMHALNRMVLDYNQQIHLAVIDQKNFREGKVQFLDLFKKIESDNKSPESQVLVIYTPEFEEDIKNIKISGFEIVDNPNFLSYNKTISEFNQIEHPRTYAGFDIVAIQPNFQEKGVHGVF